jgi:hypothetical protein
MMLNQIKQITTSQDNATPNIQPPPRILMMTSPLPPCKRQKPGFISVITARCNESDDNDDDNNDEDNDVDIDDADKDDDDDEDGDDND